MPSPTPPPTRQPTPPPGPIPSPPSSGNGDAWRRALGLLAGLGAFALIYALPAPAALDADAWTVTAVAAVMVIWWITEAVPVAVTSLLPLVLFPLTGVAEIDEAAAPYANPLTFLFMGGLIIAAAVEKWGLHKRIALRILSLFGTRPSDLVGGFMLTAALLSMWITNTATTVMMLPIVISVITLLEATPAAAPLMQGKRLTLALLLGVAYAATMGGLGTLIGTAPNALMAGMLRETYGIELGFARWMLVGVPVFAIMLVLGWWVFCRLIFRLDRRPLPEAARILAEEIATLGPPSPAERRVALVFTLTAALWILRPQLQPVLPALSDAGIAMIGAALMFMVPVSVRKGIYLPDWETARQIPWGVLLLFGGGLSLAAAVSATGLSDAIGTALYEVTALPFVLIALVFVAVVVFLTELTSNTATTATFLPIVGAVAVSAGIGPAELMIPAALAASCAFMLPVGTPPNAIVFSSGRITVAEMARAGFRINLIAILVISLAAVTVIRWVYG